MVVLLLMLGCRPSFETLGEACDEAVPGYPDAPTDVAEFLVRVNCHRRMARIRQGRGHVEVQDAIDAHADYFALNHDPETEEWTTEEVLGLLGFTGVDLWNRLGYSGYLKQDSADLDTIEVGMYLPAATPEEAADWAMEQVYLRDVVLHPGWRAGGYAQVGPWHVLGIVHDHPAGRHTSRPYTYPADGQRDVPTTWIPDAWYHLYDPVTEDPDGVVGYPISLMAGSDNLANSTGNPHGLFLVQATLHGPDGEIPYHQLNPGGEGSELHYSIGIVPQDPLEAGATYRLEATMGWTEHDAVDLTVEFRTAS